MYSDDLFRQQGTGTTRIENSDVNVGERQFISGSYAVRSTGSSAKGTAADGSFYDLELMNDQGIVYLVNTVGGTYGKYVADVRNSVAYNSGLQMNRIVTADIGMTGAPVYPANGSFYPAIFGMMNPTSSEGGVQGWIGNTVQIHGNMSNVDWGYVQGKMRQQIDATTGYQYPFVVGLEPGGAGMQKGMQYARIDFSAGADYDVLEAYFERALPNSFLPQYECNNFQIDYFGGADHGQWIFDNPSGGSSLYEMNLWPQDDNFLANAVWVITKDNGISGFSDECGPSPVGLSRGGFSGFSAFGLAGGNISFCEPPTILSTNGSFPSGSQLTITGIDFGSQQLMGSVLINGTSMPVVSWSNTEIIVTIPPTCSGDIIVTNYCGNVSPPFSYIVDNTPNIVAVSNDDQPNGSLIDIYGINFGISGTVTLNGVNVSVTNWTNTALTIIIPETCSGDLIVTNDCGEVSAGFYYNVGWTNPIVSATSGSVPSGSIVQITGTGFSTSGSLTLNGLNMDVVSWDYFNISAIVPIGVCSGDLVITNNCGNVSPSVPYIADNSNTGMDVQTACDSYTWIDGTTYTSSNNSATWILTNASGCDSIVTLDLTITNSNTGTDVQTAYDSYTWIDGNTYTASNNSATWILTNASGCDSIVTLDLTITNSNTGTDVQTACDSYTWIDGNTYTTSNNSATWTLTNASGCDSTVTLDLTITSSNTGTDVQTACDSYTWIDGNTYTTSNNTATWTLTNASGCDSTVTLDLTITNSNTGTDVQTACDSYTWIDGNTYTTSNNSATVVLTNSLGCDSTVTLDLSINPSYTVSSDSTILENELPFTWNGLLFTSSGSQTAILSTINNCDSIVIMNLTVDPLVGVLNSLNDEVNSVNLYPNPTKDELFLSIRNNKKLKCTVTLFNKLGQIVMTENYTIYNGLNEEKMNLKMVLDGSYFLKFDFGQNQVIWKKVIKI